MEWDNVIIALVMAIPPLVAQIISGIKEGRKQKTEEGHTATAEWKELYESCQKRNEALQAENERLKAEIIEKDKTILSLQEATRPRRPIKTTASQRKTKTTK